MPGAIQNVYISQHIKKDFLHFPALLYNFFFIKKRKYRADNEMGCFCKDVFIIYIFFVSVHETIIGCCIYLQGGINVENME